MSWWAVGTLVVSTAYKVTEDQKVARRQDQTLAQQIRTDSAHQQDADAAVADLINKTANSNDQGQQQSLLGKFTQQIQDARGNATGGLNQVGNVSDAYKASGADAALGIADYGKRDASGSRPTWAASAGMRRVMTSLRSFGCSASGRIHGARRQRMPLVLMEAPSSVAVVTRAPRAAAA
jgi:hypothetical protein